MLWFQSKILKVFLAKCLKLLFRRWAANSPLTKSGTVLADCLNLMKFQQSMNLLRAFRRLQQGKCNDYHSLNKIMSALTVNNVRVAGLSACVPEKVEEKSYFVNF